MIENNQHLKFFDKNLILDNAYDENINKLKAAIHIHLYYIDMIDTFISYLKESPINFDLLISVVSEDNKNMLFIPEGFAHGFVVLSDEAELLYKASGEYAPQADCGIIWNDKDINIDWGIDFEPILSEKDTKQKTLKELFN